MKRAVLLFLILSVTLSSLMLSSCQDLKGQLNSAIEKTNSLPSYEATVDMNVKATANGVSVEIPTTALIKGARRDTGAPLSYTKIDMDVLGEEVSAELYYDCTWMYYITEGETTRITAQAADKSLLLSEDVDEIVKKLPADVLEDAKVKMDNFITKTVTVKMDNDKFLEIYEEFAAAMKESVGLGANIKTLKILDSEVVITIQKGYILSYDINFDMSMKQNGVDVTVNVSASLNFIDPGKEVEITMPQDL